MAITRVSRGGVARIYGLASERAATVASVGDQFVENDTGATYEYSGSAWLAVSSPASQGAFTDRSGTITLGGTAQQSAALNAARRYLLVQNPTTATESFWISLTTTAVAASPSIEVAPGVTLTFEGTFIPTGAVSVVAATTATKFTVKEG